MPSTGDDGARDLGFGDNPSVRGTGCVHVAAPDAKTLIDAARVARVMAGGDDRRTFVLATTGAGLAFTLARFPLTQATHDAWTSAIAVLAVALLGLPVLLAEAALGQYRRRNTVDAYGPGAWRGVGFLHALGALVAAALLAVLAGWSVRYFVGSFEGTWFDDPGRHFRLLSAGPDTLLVTLGVLAVATGVAMRGVGRGLRGTVAACAVGALVLLGGLAVWANVQSGAESGRVALYDFDSGGLDASFVVAALFAGLLPAMLATGLTSSLAGQMHDRTLPRESSMAILYVLLGLAGALFFLGPLASANEASLAADGAQTAFTQVPALFAAIGGAEGGVLAGCFFAALLLASLVGLVTLLEVPATWFAESYASWTEGRGLLASGLVAFLIAVPFCFSAAAVGHLHEALAWVAAPLGALLVCLHVGWARPEVLDGFRVGDAKHRLDSTLLPALRYALAPAFLFLLVLGTLGFAQAMGWSDASGGLWRLAP